MRRSLPVPRAVLFDLDGTLADTAPDLANAVNKMRQDRGLPLTPYELLRPMASAGARGLIGVAFGIQPSDTDFEAMRTEFLANYEAQIADQTVLFEDIVALLAKIESNNQHWGIVTNKPLRYTDVLLPLIGLAHAACSISGDTTPHAKPHPEPLFEAARRLQLPPEQCWYVGDDLRDIQAGKAAGMPTIAAGWGYCGMSEPTNWDADFIAGSPREIIELLSGA
ncbi:MAG: HAD family hydrolase [Oxalobacteraceae bacterium]|nr:HAD family hydrolase [Oxalobacteraceae bacterium]